MVSVRLFEALLELGVGGLKTFPLDFHDIGKNAGQQIPGYVGLVPDASGHQPVRAVVPEGSPGVMFFQEHIILDLRPLGVDRFSWEKFEFEDEAINGVLRPFEDA